MVVSTRPSRTHRRHPLGPLAVTTERDGIDVDADDDAARMDEDARVRLASL